MESITQILALAANAGPIVVAICALVVILAIVFVIKKKPANRTVKTVLFSVATIAKTQNPSDEQRTAPSTITPAEPFSAPLIETTTSTTHAKDSAAPNPPDYQTSANPKSRPPEPAEIEDEPDDTIIAGTVNARTQPQTNETWPKSETAPVPNSYVVNSIIQGADAIAETPTSTISIETPKSLSHEVHQTGVSESPIQPPSREILDFGFDFDNEETTDVAEEQPEITVPSTPIPVPHGLPKTISFDDRLPIRTETPTTIVATNAKKTNVLEFDENAFSEFDEKDFSTTEPQTKTTQPDEDDHTAPSIIDAEARRRAQEQVDLYIRNGPTQEQLEAIEREAREAEREAANAAMEAITIIPEPAPQQAPGAIVRAVQWTKMYYGDNDSLAVDKTKRLEIIEMLKNLEDPDFAMPILDFALREEEDEPEMVTAVYAAMVESYNTEILSPMHQYFFTRGTPEQRTIARRGLLGLGYKSITDDENNITDLTEEIAPR